MEKVEKLEANQYYHISQYGNNKEVIFREKENCRYFLSLIEKHITPVAHVLGCRLYRNKFDLFVRIKPSEEIPEKYRSKLYQPFSNLFNSYAKAFNKRYGRNGSLFKVRFERKTISLDGAVSVMDMEKA